jgi:hypothetical protein
MRPETRDWLTGLEKFAAEHRLKKPLSPSTDPAQAAAERMILAAQLATWLEGWETIEGDRRGFAAGSPAIDPNPCLVITSSAVGITVAEDLVAGGSPPARSLAGRFAAVTELEYRLWCIQHPDDDSARHINLWNWIKTSVPEQRHGEFAAYPLAPGEAYWLHRCGIRGAGEGDRRDCHLWRWNGRHASLLKAFIVEAV